MKTEWPTSNKKSKEDQIKIEVKLFLESSSSVIKNIVMGGYSRTT